MQRRINVRGIIWREGTLLCQQLIHETNEPAWEPYWCTPGGGVEDGETIHEALVREMIEETGITPKIGRLLFVQQFFDGEKEQLEFFFRITNDGDYTQINLEATSHGTIEVERCEFVDPKKERVLPAFLMELNIAEYVSGNLPVYFGAEL